eukprot:1159968-Pelagomonas_calceolata.AAC.15
MDFLHPYLSVKRSYSRLLPSQGRTMHWLLVCLVVWRQRKRALFQFGSELRFGSADRWAPDVHASCLRTVKNSHRLLHGFSPGCPQAGGQGASTPALGGGAHRRPALPTLLYEADGAGAARHSSPGKAAEDRAPGSAHVQGSYRGRYYRVFEGRATGVML